MNLEVLVSTMNQKNYDLINKMNLKTDAVIINQCGSKMNTVIHDNGSNIEWINSDRKGLSISRNMAIRKAKSEICLLADDDEELVDNYKKIILEQFSIYPDADVITFQVEGIERKFKDYYKKTRMLNHLTTMKVSTVEIAFRKKRIVESGIKFNEKFGSGAKYYAGEENIFLYDCLRKGLNIRYVPIKIADLHIGNSTWFKGFDEEFFTAKGAMFAELSKMFSFALILQFAFRKYYLYKNDIRFYSALKHMLIGRSEYLSNE